MYFENKCNGLGWEYVIEFIVCGIINKIWYGIVIYISFGMLFFIDCGL